MAIFSGPKITKSSLVVNLDAANSKNTVLSAVEVLVVAGGGGSGAQYEAGGGGGGGVIYNTAYAVTAGSSYTATVGAGGSGSAIAAQTQTAGSNSVFGALTAIGGGRGSSESIIATSGGSGGGGSHSGYVNGTGTVGQGYDGGNIIGAQNLNPFSGAGGGGAGGVGQSILITASYPGTGGPGLAFNISGTMTWYGGGGAGASRNGNISSGGIGGGGNTFQNGTANTGGGGGGGSGTAGHDGIGGAGGSGIVIVRYPGAQKASGGTITTVGNYTIHTFTSGTSTFTVYPALADTVAINGLGDFSGTGLLATAVNGPVYSSANGGSITFDGTNDYVSIGNLGNLYTTGTISFWMYSTAVENYRNVFTTNYNGGNNAIRFEQYTTTSPYGGFDVVISNSVLFFDFSPSAPLTANVWYQVVLTWNTAASLVTGYLNSVQKFNSTCASWPTTMPSVAFGTGFDTIRYFKGNISNVQIYNRALSATEVNDNFQANRDRYGI